MFVIERRVAKNGNPYIAIFPNGGKKPLEGTINNYALLSALLGVTFKDLADTRANGALRLEFHPKHTD